MRSVELRQNVGIKHSIENMSTRKYMMYCHASQDAYFYDYQTHGVHLYQIVRKMRGIMTLLQQKAIMYLSSCYINSIPAVLQWQPPRFVLNYKVDRMFFF